MLSQQTDDSRMSATANDRIIPHEKTIQEKESINVPKRNETLSLALPNATSLTGLQRETNPVVEKKPVHDGDNCKLFLAYEQSKDGKLVRKYFHHHSGDPEGKAKSSTTKNRREVFSGFYKCDIPVAIVKTLVRSEQEKKGIEREFRILKELEVQENFIRYFAHEMDLDFVYVATEPCECSVADLLDTPLGMEIPMKQKILQELRAKEILNQATRGLDYLHKNHFVHRNIKPNNFLIKKVNSENACRFAVKITDFRLTRKYDPDNDLKLSGSAASEGWEAPESRDVEKDLSPKLDVFILGCFYHYVLTALPTNRISEGKPKHPFGDNEAQRVKNIRDSNYSVYKDPLKFKPKNKDEEEVTALELVRRMLKFKEEERPTLQEVLDSSYYNPSEDYKLYEDYKSPGLCVIFNQQFFQDEKKNREGSDKDRDALKDTFQKLGFNIKVHENLNSDELKSEIHELASESDFKSYGCLVVCLLSHGIENAIMCHDGKFVNTNKLKYEMSSNQEKDAHASSSRTERRETPAILHEAIPQTNTPNETTSAAVDEGKEPVGKGSKLFREKMGIDGGQYVYLSHDPNMKKEKSVQQKLENKRLIYRGFYNCYVPVAIVRTPIQHSSTARKEFERECRILKELEVHENFIRYIEHDRDNDFEYIATELCLCSIADLLDPDLMKEIPKKKDILEELDAKEILRQATRGLHYLHQNNFVHRNIKPNNFLIKEINKTGDISSRRFVVKITDFRLTRKYDPHQQSTLSGSAASEGWEAPESKDETKNLSTKLDVFILGCFYHYVLTALPTNRNNVGEPRHPFGDTTDTRRTNINNQNYGVYKGKLDFVQKDTDEEVLKLIKRMLEFKENDRPTLDDVLKNPYFNPSEFYKIYDHTKPGLCVIFNQQEFDNPKETRLGSDVDREALKNTFKGLGFEIDKDHESLNSHDLKFEINYLASKRDFGDYGCLVVCLLSHGTENTIQCRDGILLNINKLKYEFSLNNCPTLYGKPKIFIVQTCQGQLEQGEIIRDTRAHLPTPNFISKLLNLPRVIRLHLNGTLKSPPSVVQFTNEEIKKLNDYQTELREMKNQTKAQRNPPLMDFLTIKATLPGFVSYRFFETDEDGAEKDSIGSSFIQSLCKALSEEYSGKNPDESTQHLEDLLRSVQVEINKYSVGREEQGQKPYWQTMLWEVYLSKHIRFRKGVTEGELLNP
ncbi:caspase 8 [Daphnia sinensis]|uniref:Caspase 8 n=1 Tax=Daphnia sinensis TaxID=1820382 RepID=A0AAD5LM43_9CRUS|nr:caspase 8 [Daphnia sinensis]